MAPLYGAHLPAVNARLENRLPTTLTLLCAAGTRSARVGGFPAVDEPLDEGGRKAAARATFDMSRIGHVHLSPALSAVETAAAIGLDGHEETALADIDHGAWAGRTFDQIHAEEPEALARWLIDPTLPTPGGEAMSSVEQRVGLWLDEVASLQQPICAITHATVIRAALAHALHLPLRSTLAIDVAPLSRAVLSFNRTWRLQSLG